MRSVGLSLLLAVVPTAALAAQEFHPPPVRSAGDGTRLGLLGFGVRGGIDLSGKTQLVFGVTLDAGNLLSNRFRLRPSGEIGVFNGVNSYVGSLEGLYRLTGEGQAVPIARTCGSMWSWASSCTIAPRSTGCSSTTAWMGSGTTDCTPA